MNYLQFNFETDSESTSNALLAMLSVNNFNGFEETDGLLKAFVSQYEFDEVTFNEVTDQFPGLKYTKSTVENINWNTEWETNFHPVIIDDFAGIRADFHAPLPGVKHEIIITPKMSFGTGHHATTLMMIQSMREIEFKDRSVIDFGTGTGVLAILAKQLNAGEVVAVDNDEWSIENSKENFVRNAIHGINLILSDTLQGDKTFDIILANINLNFILANMEILSNMLNSKGMMLLSGFLLTDVTAVKKVIELNGLAVKTVREQDNWSAIIIEKDR